MLTSSPASRSAIASDGGLRGPYISPISPPYLPCISRSAIASDEGLRGLFKGVSINVFKVYRRFTPLTPLLSCPQDSAAAVLCAML